MQCVNKPTNKVDKNAVGFILTDSHCKEKVVGCVQQNIPMIASMFLSIPLCDLDIFGPGKCANHGGEYGLEISADFLYLWT